MNWYVDVLKKYAVFNGRARRKEYWMFFLFTMVIMIVLNIVNGLLFGAAVDEDLEEGTVAVSIAGLSMLYVLATFVPSLAVSVRRMHDTDRSGWWILVPIAPIVFALMPGQPGANRFGPDPKAGEATAAV